MRHPVIVNQLNNRERFHWLQDAVPNTAKATVAAGHHGRESLKIFTISKMERWGSEGFYILKTNRESHVVTDSGTWPGLYLHHTFLFIIYLSYRARKRLPSVDYSNEF